MLQNLSSHLVKANVSYFPITSPPALSSEAQDTQEATGQYCYVNLFSSNSGFLLHTLALSIHLSFFVVFPLFSIVGFFHSDSKRALFLEEKQRIKREHRQECHSAFGTIFGNGACMEGDLVVINFFALV